jgi:hypothetical protein
MNNREILFKTIKDLPNSFTSFDFTNMAIKNGHPALKNNMGFHEFIRRYANNEGRYSKTWHKKNSVKVDTIPSLKEPTFYMTEQEMYDHLKKKGMLVINEEKMIELLKSKGYKIMKPKNDWEEC